MSRRYVLSCADTRLRANALDLVCLVASEVAVEPAHLAIFRPHGDGRWIQAWVGAMLKTLVAKAKAGRRCPMGHYLLQVAYTSEAGAALVKNPQNRLEAVRPVAVRLGGTVDSQWMSFGDYDVVAVINMPDDVSAASFAMAVSAGGAVKAVRTTPLLSVEEGIEAMRKAATADYRPPTEEYGYTAS